MGVWGRGGDQSLGVTGEDVTGAGRGTLRHGQGGGCGTEGHSMGWLSHTWSWGQLSKVVAV